MHRIRVSHEFLSAKVDEYFMKLSLSLAAGSRSPAELKELIAGKVRQGSRMVAAEDDTKWRSDLPSRFSALQDHHFPLFITFDAVCTHVGSLHWKC
jgi:hypothetical protein